MTLSAAEQAVNAAIAILLAEEVAPKAGVPRWMLVEKLRSLHEQAARLAVGTEAGDLLAQLCVTVEHGIAQENARRAIEHLGSAEDRQGELGSWASGSGEGLTSTRNVCELQLARAYLLSALIDAEPEALEQALALIRGVETAHNNVAADFTEHLKWLRAKLAGSSTS